MGPLTTPSQQDRNAETAREGARAALKRAFTACGAALGLLFLMGLTGLASITLHFVTPRPLAPLQGLEKTVVDIVLFLEPLIRPTHTWGGYLALVLCGWAGLRMAAAGRSLASLGGEHAKAGRRLRRLGGISAMLLAISVAAQTAAGMATSWAAREDRKQEPTALPNEADLRNASRFEFLHESLPSPSAGDETSGEFYVRLHTRDLNYPLGFAAVLLALAVNTARRKREELKSFPPDKDNREHASP